MEKVVLKAETRTGTGKISSKRLREKGFVPAVVYKHGKVGLHIEVNKRDLFHVLHTSAGENVLITLEISAKDGSPSAGKTVRKGKEKTCIIKEIQKDPVKDDIIHIDLNEISLTEKIKVKVPVHPRGEAEGVTKEDGILEHVLWEVEVECLPTEIPQKIEVEITPMKIGDTVFIKDLPLPPGVKILNDPELTVLAVIPPAKEEVVEEVPGEGAEEPELIAKGKKEEEEIEGEEEAPAKEAGPSEEKK